MERVYLNELCLTPAIKFVKTHPDAVLPKANCAPEHSIGHGDTGYDLTAVEDVTITASDSAVVPVGLTLAHIDPGYWFRIEPRSGLGFKHSIQPHLGVIDNGYRGDMGVKLYNFDIESDYKVAKGDRIAQLVVYRLFSPTVGWADQIEGSGRGDRGLGSSGK
jgi:dUTP pyrophosphatase